MHNPDTCLGGLSCPDCAHGVWQTIDSAPKDGRHVLLFYYNSLRKPRTIVGSWETIESDAWNDEDGGDVLNPHWYEASWVTDIANRLEEEPSYWMPLPPNPEVRSAPSRGVARGD